MTTELRDYTLVCVNGEKYTVPITETVAPGLFVYRLPAGMQPTSPHRWRIGHQPSGRSIVDAMTREDALAGAVLLAPMTDWTQTAEALREALTADDIYNKVSLVGMGCVPPASEYMPGDVSDNGTYTDADMARFAAECKGERLDCLQILNAMSHTVPWMGLDTSEFNEAHSRIVVLAGAA